MQWNPKFYEDKHHFVSEYGKKIIDYEKFDKNINVLDIGCGTGEITYELSKYFKKVIGIDSSVDMINFAKNKYPHICFRQQDCLKLDYQEEFELVFSNAVFHWIKDQDTLLQNIHNALKINGSLISEFGGYRNIAHIQKAFKNALGKYNITYESPFNFIKASDYEKLLKKYNFKIIQIKEYSRPTPLKGGEEGLNNWIKQFFNSQISLLQPKDLVSLLEEINKELKPVLWNGKEWIADYHRFFINIQK